MFVFVCVFVCVCKKQGWQKKGEVASKNLALFFTVDLYEQEKEDLERKRHGGRKRSGGESENTGQSW